jgi:hypothetical protein
MNISIQNSNGTVDLTADPRLSFREGTDFGVTQRIAEEINNPLADVDAQRSDDWGKLREITLAIRLHGASTDEVVATAEWLQEEFLTDDEWWLVVKPDETMPDSYFRIVKSPLFAIPYNMISQARHRLDVEVKLNARPYVYGEVQTLLNAEVMSGIGSHAVAEAYGDFDADLVLHVECSGAQQSWFSLSNLPIGDLERHLDEYPARVLAQYTSTQSRSAKAMRAPTEWDINSNPLKWGYVRITDPPHSGSYRVLVRLRDYGNPTYPVRFKLFVTDWYHENTASHTIRPSTYNEYKIQGAARVGPWLWLDAGEFRTGGSRKCVLWAAVEHCHRLDSVIFLPTDMGVLGIMQYLHVFNRSSVERPSDLSWNSFTYDRPELTVDSSSLTSACYGTGLTLPAGSGTKYLVSVVTYDSLNPEVTLTYRPRYSGWARE